jgi:hypothetical protein
MDYAEQHPYVTQLQLEEADTRLETARQLRRPAMLLRPHLYQLGSIWYARYTDKDGNVCGPTGQGNSPAAAFADFDVQWERKD